MIDYLLRIFETWSAKINVWCWQKRWGNKNKGTGYKKK